MIRFNVVKPDEEKFCLTLGVSLEREHEIRRMITGKNRGESVRLSKFCQWATMTEELVDDNERVMALVLIGDYFRYKEDIMKGII